MKDKKLIIKLIRNSLTDDLLQAKYKKNIPNKPIGFGHCYIATEALYHLLGDKKSGYKPVCARDIDNETYWFLKNDKGFILDPTSDQYTKDELEYCYKNGRFCGFLTKKPSKRALILISRVLKNKGIKK